LIGLAGVVHLHGADATVSLEGQGRKEAHGLGETSWGGFFPVAAGDLHPGVKLGFSSGRIAGRKAIQL